MGVYGKRLTFGAGCWRNSSTLSPDAFLSFFSLKGFHLFHHSSFECTLLLRKSLGTGEVAQLWNLSFTFPPLPSFMYPHPPFPQVTKHFTWTQVSAFVPDGKKREDERLKGSHLGGECGLFGFRIIKQEDEKMWRSRKNAYAVEAAAPEVGPDLSLAENELDNAAFVSWSKGEIPTQIGGCLRWIPSSHRPSQISRRLLYG